MKIQKLSLKIKLYFKQELKKQIECWIPWSARSFFHRHFKQLGCIAISIDKAEELAENFPTTTANQVFCLFNTWSKYHMKKCSNKKVIFKILKAIIFFKRMNTIK